MAGEYSRELSVKVFAGQCRLIENGFRQGGPAGYGLRRLLIDESRNPKGELGRGDRKSLQTDRVVLAPGPSEEIDHVRRIYLMFVERSKGENCQGTRHQCSQHRPESSAAGRNMRRGSGPFERKDVPVSGI